MDELLHSRSPCRATKNIGKTLSRRLLGAACFLINLTTQKCYQWLAATPVINCGAVVADSPQFERKP
jgi:hypothetical protein